MRVRCIGPVSVVEPAEPSYYVLFPSAPSREGTKLDNGSSYAYLHREEVMEDQKDPPPPTGYKPCRHVKCDVGPWLLPTRVPQTHYNASRKLVQYDRTRSTWLNVSGVGAAVNAYFEQLVGYPSFDKDDEWKISRIWDKIRPQIEPKINLLVFLAELDELPKLAKSLLGKIHSLNYAGDELLELIHGSNGLKVCAKSNLKALAEVTFTRRKVAANWLELNFALLPLANDLIGLINACTGLADKLASLRKGEGKIHHVHASVTENANPEKERLMGASCTYCGSNCTYSAITSSERGAYLDVQYPGGVETRVTCTIRYRYSLPEWVDTFIGRVDALLQALGCSLSPAVLWELIPFSFVIDWILPVGSLLARARLDPFPVKTEILDFCASKRVTTSFLLSGRGSCPVSPEQTITQGRVVGYTRSTDHGILSSTPSFRRPGWYQLSLSAALLQSLWKRR